MAIDRVAVRKLLKAFEFRKLFIEELGWDRLSSTVTKQLENRNYSFQTIAEKRGVVILVLEEIPEYAIRVKLDRLIAKDHFEHLLVFADKPKSKQVWQWFRKEPGKPVAIRQFVFHAEQSGERLIQRLEDIAFTMDEEETLTLSSVTGRLRTFDVEKVTKKFYERFRTEHAAFLSFIKGIPDKNLESWYASVMINRLMFLYFIQAKGFLNGDKSYLRNKLAECKDAKRNAYYREFLRPLFFEGFAKKKSERTAAINNLLGDIPYLNGGLFQPHQIEELHGKQIQIADEAFEQLLGFFEGYDWHLDERENSNDREINPDVLGYIFEKYINQKQMGAYYTKEDITGYISQNTIIPFLLDEARKGCAVAFTPSGSVWRLLSDDPDRYIHDAMKHGAELELPSEIAAGLTNVSKRTGWNRTAPAEFALPTEIWRETIDRHQRYRNVRAKLASGEVHEVNDLVTLNLNIRQFAQDVIQFSEGPEMLRAIWKAIEKVSVLDPTCGSGAFLFAALQILKPLYEACLQRMEGFVEDMEAAGPHHPAKFSDFKETLERSEQHPNREYFILKSIIVGNLYGVDIMEEAVEICKLRLFLKLIAQVESQERIEPLPDIDFNIRAGNTLVGYARYEDVQKAVGAKLDFGDAMRRIEDKAKTLDAAVEVFRKQQTELNGTVTGDDKAELRRRFAELEEELNDYLTGEYGVKKAGLTKWKESHKPFQWFCDFHSLVSRGGFDVIIGNPPYIELKEISSYELRGFDCIAAGNLYAVTMERCLALASPCGRLGFIVPVSSVSTDRYESLQRLLVKKSHLVYSSYDDRPSRLFDGLEHIRLTIHVFANLEIESRREYSTRYNKWHAAFRSDLLNTLSVEESAPGIVKGSLPKLCSSLERSILAKLENQHSQLGLFVSKIGQYEIFYSRKVGYFLQVLDFEPRVLDGRGKKRPPSEFKALRFSSKCEAEAALCALNSSLFYWFVTVFSDCRHLNKREIEAFPVNLRELCASPIGTSLKPLAASLMKDLQSNSVERKMSFRHDTLVVQCIMPKHSKTIADKIDSALGQYYGFTQQELDFLLNYDIKYRLGAESSEEE